MTNFVPSDHHFCPLSNIGFAFSKGCKDSVIVGHVKYLFGDRDSCGGTPDLGFPSGVHFGKPGIVLWSVFRLIALLKKKGKGVNFGNYLQA